MRLILLGIGLVSCVLGLMYSYFPELVLRFNAYARAHLFKDSTVLLGHRRIGSILILLSLVLMAFILIPRR